MHAHQHARSMSCHAHDSLQQCVCIPLHYMSPSVHLNTCTPSTWQHSNTRSIHAVSLLYIAHTGHTACTFLGMGLFHCQPCLHQPPIPPCMCHKMHCPDVLSAQAWWQCWGISTGALRSKPHTAAVTRSLNDSPLRLATQSVQATHSPLCSHTVGGVRGTGAPAGNASGGTSSEEA